MIATLMEESEEELKSLLIKVKEESGKAGLKLNIQNTKITASSPIILWIIDGEKVKTVTDFIFLGSKIIMDYSPKIMDYSPKIKIHLLFGSKAMTNLDSVLKTRDITLLIKVSMVKAMDESWLIKKAECWRIDTFELWCWRRLLSLLDSKEIKPVHPKGNQAWIFIGRTDAEAEAPILWPPDAKSWLIGKDSCWETMKAGEWSNRRWDGWRASLTQ